jgi:hypothetical protein
MSAPEAPPSAWERFNSEFGWVVLVITALLGQLTVLALLTAVVEGPGGVSLEGAQVFWQVFLVTTPLTIAAIIFFAIVFAGVISSGYHLLWAGAGGLVAGAAIGTGLGTAGNIKLDAAYDITGGAGSSPTGLANTILWFLTAYFQLYGFQFFVASIILGAFFGKWAAWLYREKL